ncbi:MAG: Rieske 2Fe-2S domain-containing protein [Alphaproteobacteria bacterium]|nr:Rieske 2Fe-2S domain-containing protein [Alphaproteobacteria bacterium]
MRHEDQVAHVRKLLSHLEMRTTAIADEVYRNPVSDYTCPQQAAHEREVFFRREPINIGLGCLLPNPGDWVTHDHTGVPVLVVRQPDGSLSASLNVCRHRGARVAEGCGSAAHSFSCPYHGWTYALDGKLLARPDERSFTAIDRTTAGLRTLPVAEKYGLVWICPTPEPVIDIDRLLVGLATDFAAYDFDSFQHYETRVLQRRINWKLAVDTFLESYHIGVLHQDTIGPLFYANRSTFDDFGRNLRWILPRRTIGELRTVPEAEWDLISQAAIVYLLFPNTILVMAQDHLETWHMFPAGNGVDETRMYVSLYTPEPALTESAKRHWNNNFDLLMATVENQDFPVSEGMQRGFYSGAQDAIVFGRNEPALQHYHRGIKSALAVEGSLT